MKTIEIMFDSRYDRAFSRRYIAKVREINMGTDGHVGPDDGHPLGEHQGDEGPSGKEIKYGKDIPTRQTGNKV